LDRHAEIVLVDTSAGAATINLPRVLGGSTSEIGVPLMTGRTVTFIDATNTAATNNITLTPNANDAIGAGAAGASATITTNGGKLTLIAYPGCWLQG
jgi:hypothetical protein